MTKILSITNLTAAADSDTLESLFAAVGNVVSASVQIDPLTGRRTGLVEMSTEQEADDCIMYFHEHKVKGQMMSVVKDMPRVPRVPLNQPETRRKVTSLRGGN